MNAMSYSVHGQEVIVVMNDGDSNAKSADDNQVIQVMRKDYGSGAAQDNVRLAHKTRGKAQQWQLIETVPSHKAFENWLTSSAFGSAAPWRKARRTRTFQGTKQYYTCKGPDCSSELEVLYDDTSDEVAISHNGRLHEHGRVRSPCRGLPEATKQEAVRLLRAGTTPISAIDNELRLRGHTQHTLKQVVAFLARQRRLMRATDGGAAAAGEDEDGVDDEEEDGAVDDDVAASNEIWPEDVGFLTESSPHVAVPDPPQLEAGMDEATIGRLVASSIEARQHSHCPYSRLAVGAAVLCDDGAIVTGVNVENASFGLTVCAERTAVTRAVAEGRRRLTAVAVAADLGDRFVTPCGACRQVLVEFNADMPVYLVKPSGEYQATSMAELLPLPFLPEDVPGAK